MAGLEQKQRGKSQASTTGRAEDEQTNSQDVGDEDGGGSGHGFNKWLSPSPQGPSLTRLLLYSGILSLACGTLGAWIYWHFLGSPKSGDKNSSGNKSDMSKNSPPDAATQGKLRQMEEAWKAAVKELQQVEAAKNEALKSEEETKTILDFFKKTVLSAGRPGDGSLSEAFWAGEKARM